jgi:hypothetical protein
MVWLLDSVCATATSPSSCCRHTGLAENYARPDGTATSGERRARPGMLGEPRTLTTELPRFPEHDRARCSQSLTASPRHWTASSAPPLKPLRVRPSRCPRRGERHRHRWSRRSWRHAPLAGNALLAGRPAGGVHTALRRSGSRSAPNRGVVAAGELAADHRTDRPGTRSLVALWSETTHGRR